MRSLLLITAVIYLFSNSLCSQTVNFECEDSWGPGRYNKVILKIDFGREFDFARLTQDFPVGFDVIPDKSGGADFSFTGDKLNIVWIRITSERTTLSYYIKPDKSMEGSFTMNGELAIVKSGTNREIVRSRDININISGSNGLMPEEIRSLPAGSTVISAPKQTVKKQTAEPGSSSEKTEYRVQVATSSSQVSESEIERRLGVNVPGKMSVVKTGNIYKYQFGTFNDYKSAARLMEGLLTDGVKDAFVVAYRGDQQVPVSRVN